MVYSHCLHNRFSSYTNMTMSSGISDILFADVVDTPPCLCYQSFVLQDGESVIKVSHVLPNVKNSLFTRQKRINYECLRAEG